MKQNRRTSDLSAFATPLREAIVSHSWSNSHFEPLAQELFSLQFAANPAYRRICEALNVSSQTLKDWRQIPPVPTTAFKEFEITCLPPEQRSHVFHSSGTTAQRPSRHTHSQESLAVYEASLWSGFTKQVLPDFESGTPDLQLAALTPPPAQAPHSSLVHMFEIVRRQLGAPAAAFLGIAGGDGAWEIDFNQALATLRETTATQHPLVLLGTAFSFVQLVDFLAERNLRFKLPFGSRVMETGGYKGRSRSLPKTELHALIAEWLGIPPSRIVCEYGMSELSSQAYNNAVRSAECSRRSGERVFRFPPWARAQVISAETGREVADGETGLLRVFDLANVWSVLAVQTEDVGVRRGDGFDLLGRATPAEPRGCSLMSS